MGPGLGTKRTASKRADTNEYSPVLLPPVSLSPQWATAICSPLQEVLQGLDIGLALWNYCFCLHPNMHGTFCAPSKSWVYFSHLVGLLHSSPADLQSWMLWELFLSMPDLQTGHPDMGLRTLTSMGELLLYNCSPICGSPMRGLWDVIILWVHSSYRLGRFLLYVFGCRISSFSRLQFLLLFFILINICSAVSSDFGVPAKGGKLKVLLLWYFKPFPTICFFAKLLVDSWAFYSLLMISRSEEPFVKFVFPIKKIP